METGIVPDPAIKRLPLNSKRLSSQCIKRIGNALGTPTTASTAEVHQMIEAKLEENGHEPRNVQVLLNPLSQATKIILEDESGEFLIVDPISLNDGADQDLDGSDGEKTDGELSESTDGEQERGSLRRELKEATTENTALRKEVSNLKELLSKEKERAKWVWKINCESSIQHDLFISEKEAEVVRLKARIAELQGSSPSGVDPGTVESPVRPSDPEMGSTGSIRSFEPSATPRRGKAPPVDPFNGEESGLRFEEWLPALQRAALWNGWSEADQLLQLAGHLRGKAWQEWNLLPTEEQSKMSRAIEALTTRLDPGSKSLAAQDFRHLSQRSRESVRDFVTRLEKTFRVAYGSDPMSKETREALLFAQMQEGLKYDLILAPAVSGAQCYEQLCGAAKNEERRLAALKKRQEYGDTTSSHLPTRVPGKSTTTFSDSKAKRGSGTHVERGSGAKDDRKCFLCGKPGHLIKDCRQRKTESNDSRSREGYAKRPSAKQVDTTQCTADRASKQRKEDPLDYLMSSDSEEDGHMNHIRIKDTGSRCQLAWVDIQGVPAKGIIDSGADITIMGGELFKRVATVAKLKKKSFRRADKTPHTYDQRPFTLNGRMDLDISFGDKTMSTPVYIKMDSTTPLLLSEGVCRQLAILSYHPDVAVQKYCDKDSSKVPKVSPESVDGNEGEPGNAAQSVSLESISGNEGEADNTEAHRVPLESTSGNEGGSDGDAHRISLESVFGKEGETRDEESHATVPMVRVRLVQSVRLLPGHATSVKASLDLHTLSGQLVLEPSEDIGARLLQVHTSMLDVNSLSATVLFSNHSGFTQRMETGQELGLVEEVQVLSGPLHIKQSAFEETADVRRVGTEPSQERRSKLLSLLEDKNKLTPGGQETFKQFLVDNHLAFSLENGEKGETDLVEMHIDTGEAVPKKSAPRRMPFAVRREVASQVKKMKEEGVIQSSHSPWASPVILVKKKNGSYRFCVDYRKLNEVTTKDTFPLPRIDDLLDQVGSARYFTTLDLASGYWQIPVDRESRSKTAFTTPQGLFEFNVMPFGLTNAPAVFQRLIQEVLAGLNPEDSADFVLAYLDDILVFSRTLEEHMTHLQAVFDRLLAAGLKLNPDKCRFICDEVDYLGHVLTPGGLKTSSKHVQAVKAFPVPTSVTQVRQFLGLASYYRRFIISFAKVAQPLHALTKKNAQFEWSSDCQRAFELLKEKLVKAPLLAYPNFTEDFIVETDASILGLGAVLSQVQEDEQVHPIAYASRALSPPEKNYGITDLETLAVVWALSHFKAYLYGQKVKVLTDHTAVKSVLLNPNANGKHARWWTRVFDNGISDVAITYRRGRENLNADALSRAPVGEAPPNEDCLGVSVISVNGNTSLDKLFQASPIELSFVQGSLGGDQRKDPKIKEIIDFVEGELLPTDERKARKISLQASQYVISDKILYYLDTHRGSRKRAVVPEALQVELLQSSHGGPFSGHFSGQRMYNTLASSFWWEGMYKDTLEYCKRCPQCATVSGGGRPGRPPLQSIPVCRPFQIIGVDIMDLPKTELGNKHVLVFQDFLSKWPLVFPIPDQKTHRIVDLLVKEVIPLFGVPENLLSDRGTNLLSFLMRDVCDLLGITKINTTAYHPQCNGLVERFNRTLKTMVRKHVETWGKQWDVHLHGLLWAYRNTPHEATGEKPSFLLFGKDLRSPTEATFLPQSEMQSSDVQTYRSDLAMTLMHARENAAKAIQKSQKRSKKYYDRKTRPNVYRNSDWVMIYFPHEETGAQRKLSRPWHGPYRIISTTPTGVVAEKVYAPQNGTIQVHLSRVSSCPPDFPAGYYWYGNRRSGPGRPPKWLNTLGTEVTDPSETDLTQEESNEPAPEMDLDDDQTFQTPANQDPKVCEQPVDTSKSISVPGVDPSPRRTRTRTVKPPDRLMNVRVARDELT